MSVLSTISKRLKTDLADVARASVDPRFANQMAVDQFRDKEWNRERNAALKDAEVARQQKFADERFDIQKTILMKAHQTALDDPTGKIVSPGWLNFMKLGQNPNLNPRLREAWGLMAEGLGQRSADANKEMFQQVLDLDKAMREKTEFEFSPANRAQNELIDEKWKKDYETAQNMMNAPTLNRQEMVAHLRNTFSIFSEAEKDDIITRMTNAQSDQEVKEIYNQAFSQGNSKYQTKREMMAFPERFSPAEPWYSEETGEQLGTKQMSPEGKWVYTDDPSKRGPLVSMSAGEKVKDALKKMGEAEEAAAFAQQLLRSNEFITKMIGDVETGAFTSAKVLFGRIAASLNLPVPDDLDALIASETATGDIGMALLEAFPGQISNAEREFVIRIAPGLSQTREGRKLVSEFWKRTAQRRVAKMQIMSEYMQGDPDLYPANKQSFNARWQEYQDMHPVYEDMAVPPGREKKMGYEYRVIVDPRTRRPFYLSFDGQYRDADGIIWVSQ